MKKDVPWVHREQGHGQEPGALAEPERLSQERQEQHPGPQLSPVMAEEPEHQT